uniref:Insulin receptor substrate 1 n=1 Tax=Pelusios castaneus TaxID=367368 RepID=A0A8C8RM45_9SAUR
MEGDPLLADIRICGHLRKQKSQRRRFFALRAPSERGPAQLECYESEKKFRAGGARPRRTFPLTGALNIHKRADARHRHLIVLYGRDGTFGLAADSAEEQQAWYSALMELHAQGQPQPGSGASSPAPFREVWQVSLRPKGLGQAKNLVGIYRLCLAVSTVELVRLSASTACVVLQLLSVRRCGHSENYFFLEVGRSAATGPGELWMQVEDLVVAQNIHETILEAMKALSEECRLRGRSQSSASAPISVPARRLPVANAPGFGRRPAAALPSHADCPPGDPALVSSDEGGSSSPGDRRREPADSPEARLATGKRASPPLGRRKAVAASASFPEGLNRGADPGYVAMLPGVAPGRGEQDYVPMSPSSVSPPRGDGSGYMVMSPRESRAPGGRGWAPGLKPSEYMNMSPLCRSAGSSPSPGVAGKTPGLFLSLPRSYKAGATAAVPGRLSYASSTSSESLEEMEGVSPRIRCPPGLLPGRAVAPTSRSPGEYISIEYRPGTAHPAVRTDAHTRRCHGSETSLAPGLPAEGGTRRGATAWEEASGPELGLNYIDLDLAREGGGPEGGPQAEASASPHAYASIDFHRSQRLRGCRGGKGRPGC